MNPLQLAAKTNQSKTCAQHEAAVGLRKRIKVVSLIVCGCSLLPAD
ncbi:hypothetical protein METHB2_1290002 [Candidatus Methylobacter favarea]|uniref:Uncharacterized protein n=1 Tax=Candidatus Methylobacter favarea TaxID=2707345 RepID=A0A8S0W961_9GAMM|nr:hypothetical protein METHB2_1290002 [Candidatus Methylobacter favarea]